MPKIYYNIAETLFADLDTALGLSTHADFCVGYFNLRGWRHLDARIANWTPRKTLATTRAEVIRYPC